MLCVLHMYNTILLLLLSIIIIMRKLLAKLFLLGLYLLFLDEIICIGIMIDDSYGSFCKIVFFPIK